MNTPFYGKAIFHGKQNYTLHVVAHPLIDRFNVEAHQGTKRFNKTDYIDLELIQECVKNWLCKER